MFSKSIQYIAYILPIHKLEAQVNSGMRLGGALYQDSLHSENAEAGFLYNI